jgi:hypothetical protein
MKKIQYMPVSVRGLSIIALVAMAGERRSTGVHMQKRV